MTFFDFFPLVNLLSSQGVARIILSDQSVKISSVCVPSLPAIVRLVKSEVSTGHGNYFLPGTQLSWTTIVVAGAEQGQAQLKLELVLSFTWFKMFCIKLIYKTTTKYPDDNLCKNICLS